MAQPAALADRAHVSRADPQVDRIREQFEAAGFEPADAAGRARLVLEAVKALSDAGAGEAHWGWFGKDGDYSRICLPWESTGPARALIAPGSAVRPVRPCSLCRRS